MIVGVLMLLTFEPDSTLHAILTIPEIIWEASVRLYLTFKGIKLSPLIADDARLGAAVV